MGDLPSAHGGSGRLGQRAGATVAPGAPCWERPPPPPLSFLLGQGPCQVRAWGSGPAGWSSPSSSGGFPGRKVSGNCRQRLRVRDRDRDCAGARPGPSSARRRSREGPVHGPRPRCPPRARGAGSLRRPWLCALTQNPGSVFGARLGLWTPLGRGRGFFL